MQILGVWDGHDAGVAWWRDGRYECCLNEERVTRNKRQAGFPRQSLELLIRTQGLDPRTIDIVAVPGRYGRLPMRLADSRYRRQALSHDPLSVPSVMMRMADGLMSKFPIVGAVERDAGLKRVRSRLAALGITAPVVSVAHHEAHALTAICTPHDDALIVTMDGYGDGECGRLAFRTAREQALVAPRDSAALVYGAVTSLLGFGEGDEGKIMGLAAHGDPEVLRGLFGNLIGKGGCRAGLVDARTRTQLKNAKREDVAAALQEATERLVCEWVGAVRAQESTIAVSGGLFANVALNGKLHQLFDDIYVFPHMGDGGLCVGAVEAVAEHHQFPEVPFLGPIWTRNDVVDALARAGLGYREPAAPEQELATALIAGKMVARWSGRSAFGPRALGHRSIFIRADQPSLVDELNRRLGRDEFMPFAPIRRAGAGSKTMTVVHRADAELISGAQAAVHRDGTCRTQIVDQRVDSSLWDMLETTEKSGLPAVINTSFNVHGEPIVESPQDAIQTFLNANLDRLQLGPFIVDRPARG